MSVTGWDGVTLTVEVALSAATSVYGLWGSAIWDTSTWGPDQEWVDVTAYLRSARTSRGFSRGTQGWQAGTASIVLNNRDGRFSPANLSGPYVTSGITQIRPQRPVRIRAAYAGTTYPVWRGYVTEWRETWSGGAVGEGDAIVTLACQDEWTRLAAIDGYAQPADGAGETSGVRIHRILDAAGHTGDRNIAVGEVTMQATTLEDDPLAELELTADSEGGALYVGADGAVVFAEMHALIEDTASISSQATFGDGGGSELPYVTAEVEYTADHVVNYASYTRVGGAVQDAGDATSQSLYGLRRDTRTDLICETDAQALALAQWAVEQYREPELRFTRIVIKPRRSPAGLWPQVLGRAVREQITVRRQPPGGYTIERACHISGVSHDITPAVWVTTFDLASASVYAAYASSRWDLGEWNESIWSF